MRKTSSPSYQKKMTDNGRIRSKPKKFKDPIYGYIEVDESFISTFIDTPCFQRLRYIIQTSYSSVYMTALHNRFTHSLGVYHLGKFVFNQIKNFVQENKNRFSFEDSWIEWIVSHEEIFLAACLLHDVGHAPFSHSGEIFYDEYEDEFYRALYNEVNDEHFKKDSEKYRSEGRISAPHERMSVLLSLREYKDFFDKKNPEDRAFFARCITGYQYEEDDETGNDIRLKNCFVKLLNSDLIDVDRLDYLIRDAFMSGYQNVSLDYQRILGGMVIVRDRNKITLAYHRSAMSIIENVIYARDSEKKWIQNHPTILYESFLIDHCIKMVQLFFDYKKKKGESLFSIHSIGECGNNYGKIGRKNNERIDLNFSLLSDIDILFLIKNISSCQDDLTREYFNRNLRRRPLWKSEEEYKHFFHGVEDKYKESLYKLFLDIQKLLSAPFEPNDPVILPIINNRTLNVLRGKVAKMTDAYKKNTYNDIIKYFEIFKDFADDNKVEFDFLVITTEMFQSSFSDIKTKKINIWYPHSSGNMVTTRNMDSVLDAKEIKSEYFYLYYKRTPGVEITIPIITKLCNDLAEAYETRKN
jgi:HD superfamily phosphohydrolase